MKKTLVIGASTNSQRTAYFAVQRLKENGIEVIPLGLRAGNIEGVPIVTGKPELSDIHTVSLYLNEIRQKEYYDYILGLKPKRIIFNPGTENIEFMQLAKSQGIEAEFSCMLVMLSVDDF